MTSPATHLEFETEIEPLVLKFRPVVEMTEDQFFEFCRLNEPLQIERTKEGNIEIMSPAGPRSSSRNFQLGGLFFEWQRRDGRGLCFDSSAGFILPNGAERSPDIAWIRWERWEALTDEQQEQFSPICPDFVLELRSRTDSLRHLKAKMAEYIANGAQLGWLLDPMKKRVYVYRPESEVECLEDPETVSGDSVLAGFVLDVRAVWNAFRRPKP